MKLPVSSSTTWLCSGVCLLLLLNLAPAPAEEKTPVPSIAELTIEHSQCFGRCPVYKATLRADGRLVYEGEKYVPHLGTFQCTRTAHTRGQFEWLTQLAAHIPLNHLKPFYGKKGSDASYTTATFLYAGKRHTVKSENGTEPYFLVVFEKAFDLVVAKD